MQRYATKTIASLALAAAAVGGGALVTATAGADPTSTTSQGVSVLAADPTGSGAIECSYSITVPSTDSSSATSGTAPVVTSGTLPTLDPSTSGLIVVKNGTTSSSQDGSVTATSGDVTDPGGNVPADSTVVPVTSGSDATGQVTVGSSEGSSTSSDATPPVASTDPTSESSGNVTNPDAPIPTEVTVAPTTSGSSATGTPDVSGEVGSTQTLEGELADPSHIAAGSEDTCKDLSVSGSSVHAAPAK